jgi:hypothetical protein
LSQAKGSPNDEESILDDIAGREITAAVEKLPLEVVTAAQERGKQRDIWRTAAELLAFFHIQITHRLFTPTNLL